MLWLEPADVPLWLQDVQEVEAIDGFDWVPELSPDLGASLEEARYFEAPGKRAALLEEGVLALWYSTMY